MKSIEIINKEINDSSELLQSAKAKLKRLNQVKASFDNLTYQRKTLIEQLKKEEQDVEKLMNFSFSNLLSTLLRNKEEKLSKEEREVLEAKSRLDQVVYEYEETKDKLEKLYHMKKQLPNMEKIFLEKLQVKREYIEINHPEHWQTIQANDKAVEELRAENKEVTEALQAGKSALAGINAALDALGSASSWGTYDMIGGGLMSSMIKHQKIDEAKATIQSVNHNLQNFQRELSDTNINKNFEIRFDGMTRFTDMFLDNIFTDISVQNKIKSSISDVQNLRNEVTNLIKILESKKADNALQIERLNNRNLDLIKNKI